MRKDAVGDEIIHTEEKKVAKGIAKCEIKKNIGKNHELYIDLLNKTGLCSFDDKRYWINPVESYAFGHYKINL